MEHPDATEDTDSEAAPIVGSREQLLHLLAEAAEIEHTLMCTYLYAAFSLKTTSDHGPSPEEAGAVSRWQKAIMAVAIEEMGHLLLVANLTAAIGGRPHFDRPNFPVSAGYFPSGLVVRLTPFSMETLEHFIFLERPRGMGGDDAEAFEQQDYAREQAYRGLMPGAQDYETVGHLYDAIRANFCTLAARLGEEQLFIGSAVHQLGGDVVDMKGLCKVGGLDATNRAINVIVEQGEGSPADLDDSHYRTFIGIREEFAQFCRSNQAFVPARPVAESPVLRRPLDPGKTIYVENLAAAIQLDFACATYGLILRLLVQCFCRYAPDPVPEQKCLLSTALALMKVLGEASRGLTRLNASSNFPGVNAGMPFTMLRGVEPLIPGDAEECVLREELRDLSAVAQRIGLPSSSSLAALAETFGIRGEPAVA